MENRQNNLLTWAIIFVNEAMFIFVNLLLVLGPEQLFVIEAMLMLVLVSDSHLSMKLC